MFLATPTEVARLAEIIYGSDIQRMLFIQQGIYNDRDCLGACVHIFKQPNPTDNPSMSDKELEVINKLDDEIDDILHLCKFRLEIERRLCLYMGNHRQIDYLE